MLPLRRLRSPDGVARRDVSDMAGLKKDERLYEQGLISKLFAEGRRLSLSVEVGKVRAIYLIPDASVCRVSDLGSFPKCKVMVSVPKKHFRRAVDRNRLKRLLRESYRSRKDILCGVVPPGRVMLLSLQYVGDSAVSMREVDGGVRKILRILESKKL